ncbi:MAG: DUF3362 domain-containing protein, partial [Paucibacter sp.]|nr:DUF3362 domain-containing protein [Roseateles sp.]
TYDKFKQMFEKASEEAGKKQYLIPYFIAAHPGTSDEDMMNLAVWLKKNGFRADQVQTFYPSPMATATAMYHSGKNPLKKITRSAETSETVDIVRGERRRRLHKAFLRYHDANNWPMLREALKTLGREDLIGNGKHHLIPTYQPVTDGSYESARRKNSTPTGVRTSVAKPLAKQGLKHPGSSPQTPRQGQVLTQHTGLPPRDNGSRPAGKAAPQRASGKMGSLQPTRSPAPGTRMTAGGKASATASRGVKRPR